MEMLTVDSAHDKPDLCGVGRAGEVGVDLLGFGLVQRYKAVEDVIASSGVVRATFIVGEVVLHRTEWQLLLESIDLIEEENDAGLDEPPGIADAVKQCESFLHTVDSLVFEQQLVVL